MTGERAGARTGGRIALAVFFVCFSVFVVNVLLGKLSIVFGWQRVPLLSDVAEFLLLLIGVTVFMIATLQLERADAPKNGPGPN